MSSDVLSYPLDELFESSDSKVVTPEARRVEGLVKETREQLWSSRSLGSSREECRNQLLDAYREAAFEGWDGYAAHKFEESTLLNGFAFIDSLPRSIPMPEVSVDPDGEVSFDWICGARQFSISLGGRGVMSYAGLFGSDKVAGSERFQGTLPRTIVDFVKRVAV
jgi:hypothetical protein